MGINRNVQFFAAVSCGDVKRAAHLLNKGVSPNFVCYVKGGRSYPLLVAVKRNNTTMVKLLLDYGARRCGESPLSYAMFHYNIDVLRMLVEKGCMYTGMVNPDSLLYTFCRNMTYPWNLNYEKIGNFLLACGASPFAIHYDDDTFPLWVAAEKGNLAAIQLLVEYCRANNCLQELIHQKKAETFSTPLYLACQNGHYHTVEYLLKMGANVDATTAFGVPALFVAADRGHLAIVQELLLHGADPTLRHGTARIAYDNGHDEVGDLISKSALVKDHAKALRIAYFLEAFEKDDLLPYPKQWVPHLPFPCQYIFQGLVVTLMEHIEQGRLPNGHARLLRELPHANRSSFYRWLAEAFLLQKVCASATFTEMYVPVPKVIEEFLVFPLQRTRSLVKHLYRQHAQDFPDVLNSW